MSRSLLAARLPLVALALPLMAFGPCPGEEGSADSGDSGPVTPIDGSGGGDDVSGGGGDDVTGGAGGDQMASGGDASAGDGDLCAIAAQKTCSEVAQAAGWVTYTCDERCGGAGVKTSDCDSCCGACVHGNDDEYCGGGQVCAWNGGDYCCREPGNRSGEACATDTDCMSGEVCAWNGEGFTCSSPECSGYKSAASDSPLCSSQETEARTNNNWQDLDMNGVGTHRMTDNVNVRADDKTEVVFTATPAELFTTNYRTDAWSNGYVYLEVFFQTGNRAGTRGWAAEDFMAYATLHVCNGDAQVLDATTNDSIATAEENETAQVASGVIKNVDGVAFFDVEVSGVRGYVSTEMLCPGAGIDGDRVFPITVPYQGPGPKQAFGYARGRLHAGVDLVPPRSMQGAANSYPILAYRAGTVTIAQKPGSYGIVQITHEDGTASRYLHNSSTVVEVGQEVSAGETIAYMGGRGPSGNSAYVPHLHFELCSTANCYGDGSQYDPIPEILGADDNPASELTVVSHPTHGAPRSIGAGL